MKTAAGYRARRPYNNYYAVSVTIVTLCIGSYVNMKVGAGNCASFCLDLSIPNALQAVFEVHPVVNGNGDVKFAWQKSSGSYLAVTGLV